MKLISTEKKILTLTKLEKKIITTLNLSYQKQEVEFVASALFIRDKTNKN